MKNGLKTCQKEIFNKNHPTNKHYVSIIKSVNHCILSIDDDRTVCKTIEKIVLDFGEEYELSCANGGDQNNNTIPERPICDQMGITLVDGLGDKIQSSSWLLKK